MNRARKLACGVVLVVCGLSLAANWLAPAGYARQFREAPNAPPSHQHLLGTDDVGRDRFARVLYGTRISLLLAPAAALISTTLAALVGGLAGYLGGIWLGLFRPRAIHQCRCPAQLGLYPAGSRLRLAWSTPFSDSRSAQPQAGALRPILDFDSSLHPQRGQSRH